MKQTSIRELKHETSKVLALVESGETVEVRRRKQAVALLLPPGKGKAMVRPDFAARMREDLRRAGAGTHGNGSGGRSEGRTMNDYADMRMLYR